MSSFDLVPVTMASVNSSVLLVLLIATQHGARIRKWPVLLWCQGCSIWMGLICGDWSENDSNTTNTQAGKNCANFRDPAQVAQKRIFPNKLEKMKLNLRSPAGLLNSTYIGNFAFRLRVCISSSHLYIYRMHSIFPSIEITSFQHVVNSKTKGSGLAVDPLKPQ